VGLDAVGLVRLREFEALRGGAPHHGRQANSREHLRQSADRLHDSLRLSCLRKAFLEAREVSPTACGNPMEYSLAGGRGRTSASTSICDRQKVRTLPRLPPSDRLDSLVSTLLGVAGALRAVRFGGLGVRRAPL